MLLAEALVGLGLASSAHGAAVLTWEDCLREAVRNSPRLEAARSGIDGSRSAFKGTFGTYLPTLSGVLELDRSQVLFPDTALNAPPSNIYRWGPRASWNLFSGFGGIGTTMTAYHNLQQAKEGYRRLSASVRLELRQDFGRLLFIQEQLRLLEGIVEKLRADADIVKIRYEGGGSARWTYLKAKAEAEQAEWEKLQAELLVRSIRQRLVATMGRPEREPIEASGSLAVSQPPPSVEPFVAKGLESHPEVSAQKEALASARALVVRAQSRFWPSADTTFAYLWQDDKWPPSIRSWSLGLSLTVPLFSGGSGYYGVREAGNLVKERRKELEDARLSVESNIEDAFAVYRASYARLKAVRSLLDAAAERQETLRAQYKAGLANFFEWNFAVDQHTELLKSELAARLGAYLDFAAWERSLGSGLESGP